MIIAQALVNLNLQIAVVKDTSNTGLYRTHDSI